MKPWDCLSTTKAFWELRIKLCLYQFDNPSVAAPAWKSPLIISSLCFSSQSICAAIAYFYSNYFVLQWQLLIMVLVGFFGTITFFSVEWGAAAALAARGSDYSSIWSLGQACPASRNSTGTAFAFLGSVKSWKRSDCCRGWHGGSCCFSLTGCETGGEKCHICKAFFPCFDHLSVVLCCSKSVIGNGRKCRDPGIEQFSSEMSLAECNCLISLYPNALQN